MNGPAGIGKRNGGGASPSGAPNKRERRENVLRETIADARPFVSITGQAGYENRPSTGLAECVGRAGQSSRSSRRYVIFVEFPNENDRSSSRDTDSRLRTRCSNENFIFSRAVVFFRALISRARLITTS